MTEALACDMSVFTEPGQRTKHETESRHLFTEHAGIKALPEGYALRYHYSVEKFISIAHWITQESRCCPFFNFALSIEKEDKDKILWLSVGGSAEIKDFIAANFKSLLPGI